MFKSALAHTHGHVLSHAMIVVAADDMVRLAPYPINAGGRFESIIDQVAKEQANVVRFVDRLQGRPIGMNVGKQKYAHRKPKALKNQ
jgi:hypothetical protein